MAVASKSRQNNMRYVLLALLVLHASAISAQAQWWTIFFPRPRPAPTPTPTATRPPSTPTLTQPQPTTTSATVAPQPTTTSIVRPTTTRTATPTAPVPTAVPTNVPAACPNGVRTRRPFTALSQAERAGFAAAVNNMARSGEWARFTLKHREGMRYHGTTQFLPMHRALLVEFEEALVRASGGALSALPYWDELVDSRSPFANRALWSTSGIGEARSGSLTAPFSGLRDDSGRLVARQPSSGSGNFRWLPTNELLANAIGRFQSYGEMSNTIEMSPHNQYHVLIGGQMNNPSLAPADPVFWLHHAYTDLLWATYQAQSDAKFLDLTTGAGDIPVLPNAPTVLYEDRYTNNDMLRYRQRLCYEYATLPGSNGPTTRAMRALQDSPTASEEPSAAPSAESTTVTSSSSSTDSSTASATPTGDIPLPTPTPIIGDSATEIVPKVEAMPEQHILEVLHMMEPEKAIARVRAAESTLNRICDELNAEAAAKVAEVAESKGLTREEAAKVVVAELPKVSDLVQTARLVAATIPDDYKDTKIPAVEAARKVLVDKAKESPVPGSGASGKALCETVLVTAAALAAIAAGAIIA